MSFSEKEIVWLSIPRSDYIGPTSNAKFEH